MTYRRGWQIVWFVVAAAVVGPAILFWSPSAVVAVFVFAVLLSASVVAVVMSPDTGTGAQGPRNGWVGVLRMALVGGIGTVAALSLAQLSAGAALLLAALAVGTSPVVLARLKPLLSRREHEPSSTVIVEPSPSLPPRPVPADDSALAALSNAQLCDTWRRSLLALHAARDVRSRMRAVHLREACLDEMERRNPDGMHAWLESGPSGSPDRYLADRTRHAPGQEPQGHVRPEPPEEPPAEPDAA